MFFDIIYLEEVCDMENEAVLNFCFYSSNKVIVPILTSKN